MLKAIFALLLIISLLISGCGNAPTPDSPADSPTKPTTGSSTTPQVPNHPSNPGTCSQHVDDDNNTVCDLCSSTVFVYFDFYAINDLHGKLADGSNHPGVDELTTYLKNAKKNDENAIFISSGDMWQGASESNLTSGKIVTDWMNEMDFAGMALGNHEFDWGTDAIKENHKIADFPFLAINIYDRDTNKRVDYCAPSVVVEGDGLQIGIIGAIGDCYSSIAVDKCQDVYFKTGRELTNLVKAEAQRLRDDGVDFIVYTIHDGYGQTRNGPVVPVTGSQISSYYDTSLSDGYIDLVFEGHTHQGYRLQDEYGVYHLQHRGDNKGGISHVEVAINTVTNTPSVRLAELVTTSEYDDLDDDPIVESLLEKYEDQISIANQVVGFNGKRRSGDEMRQLVADMYYQTGIERWGQEYDIVLGGGFISVRSPGYLAYGDVTYGMLQALFPFDNQLTLCSVKGRDLWKKFLNTDNDNYFISYGDYGAEVYNNIDMNATYYIITDTYSAYYASNKLTVVAEYDAGVYARDLLADYMTAGGLE
ncbi:MAG: hypothetical protein E7466_00535 [Ruminococcaceae bacterium]|nr:hypothetical protein [Oscillospiraceae bacterium]